MINAKSINVEEKIPKIQKDAFEEYLAITDLNTMPIIFALITSGN